MTSKEALETIKEIPLDEYKGYKNVSYLYKDEIEILEQSLEHAEKQEKLLELYKEYFEYSEMLKDGRKFGGRMLVEHERDKIIEEIKELENDI